MKTPFSPIIKIESRCRVIGYAKIF